MTRVTAVELAPGIIRIPTIGTANTNSFAVVDDDGSVTLVDCGLKWAPAGIVAGLRAVGRHPGDVVRIVLSHAHTDHAGGAAEMVARTGARLAAHEADAAHAREHLSAPRADTLFHHRRLRLCPRPLCTDFRLNERAAHVLGELAYDRVAFTHGPEILSGARDAVRAVVTASGHG